MYVDTKQKVWWWKSNGLLPQCLRFSARVWICILHETLKNCCWKGFPNFPKKCQVDLDCFNNTEKAKIKRVLEQLSNDAEDVITEDASQAQGTTYLLRNRLITNKENSEMLQVDGQCQENEGSRKSSDVEGECRKDLGEKRRLHSWSRGVLVIVGGGFYIWMSFLVLRFWFSLFCISFVKDIHFPNNANTKQEDASYMWYLCIFYLQAAASFSIGFPYTRGGIQFNHRFSMIPWSYSFSVKAPSKLAWESWTSWLWNSKAKKKVTLNASILGMIICVI